MGYQSTYGGISDFESPSDHERIIFLNKKRISTRILDNGYMIDRYKFNFFIPETGTSPSLEISFAVDQNEWIPQTAEVCAYFPKDLHIEAFELISEIDL